MAFDPPQAIGYTGVNVTFVNTSGLEAVAGADRRFLWVKNASGVSTTVTVAIPGTTFGQNNPDAATVITAGSEAMIGPLPADIETPGVGVLISISPATSVSGAYVDLPKPPPDLP